nr:LamB/YcsF family protein [Phycisphaerales bacterium]
MKPIDLNADVGESPERIEADLALVSVVTSANIACGGHAGDASSMERLVRVCLATGCSIGAHPSYPDRAGFGRSDMAIGLSEIHRHVADQVASLARIAESLGANVGHVKPHGALYHAAAGRVEVADVLADAVMMVVPEAAMIGPCGSPGAARWRARGLAVVEECFA